MKPVSDIQRFILNLVRGHKIRYIISLIDGAIKGTPIPIDFRSFLQEIPKLVNKPVIWKDQDTGQHVIGSPVDYALEHGADAHLISHMMAAGCVLDFEAAHTVLVKRRQRTQPGAVIEDREVKDFIEAMNSQLARNVHASEHQDAWDRTLERISLDRSTAVAHGQARPMIRL